MNGQHQHNQRASHFRLRGRFPPPLSPSPSSAAAAANGDGSSSFATIATTDTTTPEQDSTAELQRLLRVPGTEICRSPSSTEEFDDQRCYFTISSTSSALANQQQSPQESPRRQTKRPHRRKSPGDEEEMSQDAEDGPEVLFHEPEPCMHRHGHLFNAARPPMNQDEFDQRFNYRRCSDDGELCKRTRSFMRHYYRPCMSANEFARFLIRLVPILGWLPSYSWRECLFNDIVGGFTVGIMHVPQGIAYAMLAKLHPVVGLYTSFFPPLFYMLFGTSRHNSIGSFAVVSLMAGMAVEQFSSTHGFVDSGDENKVNLHLDDPQSPVAVASTLAFTIGLLQIMMGTLRLELITTYFSDQVVAGFTTGASMHVFVAQLQDVFGLKDKGLPKRSGAGYLFLKLYDTITHLHKSNPTTLLLAFSSIAFLVVGKEFLNPFLKRRFRLNIPLPFELFIVLITTAIGQALHLHSRNGVDIVGKIPTGIPSPILPNLSLIPHLLPNAFGIAAVVIAVHISLAKMFAKKKGYRVDPGQELYALGFSSSLSAFFPVYPVSCSLGRTLVNVEAGTKTQFSTLFSSALLAAIILYMGQWLRTLPMCVLSAVIIVALKGMFKKITDLKMLWPLSKIDFSIWLISFLATVCWDVTEGLAVSIGFALMTTVFRTQWPRWHFLANLSGTNDFRDAERYQMVCSYPGICIFRFDSPLLFTNVDNFKETIHRAFRHWNRQQSIRRSQSVPPSVLIPMDLLSPDSKRKRKDNDNDDPKKNGSDEEPSSDSTSGVVMTTTGPTRSPPPPKIVVEEEDDEEQEEEENDDNDGIVRMPPKPLRKGISATAMEGGEGGAPPPYSEKAPIYYRHFIIDCSGFTFVDCMGVNALKEIFTEMREERVLVYFAAAKAPVRDLFEKCGFFHYVQKHNFYPTIRDAVAIARKRRNASTQYLLDEPTERQYDAMHTAMDTQPMN